jgi:hypothetical protein
MSRTARDWGRGYVPGTTPSECELYHMCIDWGRGYEPGAAPVGVVPAAPAPGPHVARVGRRCRLRLAGRDTSWSNVTRAVGVYQARPLSVVDVTARRWRPAGSVGPIRVSREFTYLGALLRGVQ